jgi:NAD(P)H-dependent flavin oxidoreductase YrpB (nitropropane dioxygenase family)
MAPLLGTRLTERFGCTHPFAPAGMAFAGETPDLAIAVNAAGGIGAVDVGFMPAEALRGVIAGTSATPPVDYPSACQEERILTERVPHRGDALAHGSGVSVS